MKIKSLGAVAIALLLAASTAHAGEETLDIDNRFRAKIAKQKLKQAAGERLAGRMDKASDDSDCGSQNIGVINNSRPRAGSPPPREVFVFAPNAVNIVGRGGCQ